MPSPDFVVLKIRRVTNQVMPEVTRFSVRDDARQFAARKNAPVGPFNYVVRRCVDGKIARKPRAKKEVAP